MHRDVLVDDVPDLVRAYEANPSAFRARPSGDFFARGSQGCSALDVSKVLVHGWILAAVILGIVWVRTVQLAGLAAHNRGRDARACVWRPACMTLRCIVRMQIFASGDLVVSHVRRPPDAPVLASTMADLARLR